MSAFKFYESTVGRKFVTGLAGILLVGFLFVHLGGNLTMLVSGGLFNNYTHHLESLGVLLYIVEIVLLGIFVAHIVTALNVQLEKRRARPKGYAVNASKGAPSRQTLASRSMIVTGLVLLVFVPVHVWMFKFNQGQPSPTMMHNGKEIRDLYGIVVTAFKQPLIAWGYAAVMFLLGFHLRHGFWSAFQSMGALNRRLLPAAYALGLLVALLLASGFILLPLWIHYVTPAPGL
ncbi:MAG: succinate dehydrogenase cytochrome b subunit [Candidatus Krumholzibacteria bacterium]|nr:succinate dehydrogenase cytochrome b subunit [Candidatus Krumholzibacteria bacterium]MDH4337735.1 succinate dehydrogenase cytochrome b subunit [Candidatus Krumholzibacteria bacterium]MDH5270637.1 succinate dehydrogenase cytochrome b subunit [Candidatus Krumholzibacteria bacterium]MDH5627022.1 succinate dehydrogenase cytochrome b subunit [Candidatus Krumholzibacteria bacterium]